MSLIQIQHLTFSYEKSFENIFEDVSFQIETTHKSALIGRNAKGKTTLLKLLMGEYIYQGQIIKSEDCEYFPYHVNDASLWTIDVCFEIAPDLMQWQIEKELNALCFDLNGLYRSFDSLSYGERVKVLLAVLFLKEHSFLLIDEPTDHLDQETRMLIAQYLNKQRGFLLVSHDRTFIDMCCNHVIAIENSHIECVKGNFSSWYEDKMKRDENELKQNDRLKKEINRLEESKRTSAKWSDAIEKTKNGHRVAGLRPDRGYIGHQAAKMMKRSKNIENRQNKAILEKKGLLKDVEVYDDLKVTSLDYHQKDLMSFTHFSLFYTEDMLFQPLTFSIQSGDRILLKGRNGSGKSSLLQFILKENIKYQGDYSKGSQLKISYVPQNCSHLTGSLEALIQEYNVDETLVKTILRKFGFSRIHFEMKLEEYSEGQKKKVMLAISLSQKAHLHIWDEPFNYIDIFSRMQIEKLILNYHMTILFIEHDTSFQQNIATKIIDIHK